MGMALAHTTYFFLFQIDTLTTCFSIVRNLFLRLNASSTSGECTAYAKNRDKSNVINKKKKRKTPIDKPQDRLTGYGLEEDAACHDDSGKYCEALQRALEAELAQEVLERVGQEYGEDGTAGRHDAVHEAQVTLEVVTEDHEARRVSQARSYAVHHAVRQT